MMGTHHFQTPELEVIDVKSALQLKDSGDAAIQKAPSGLPACAPKAGSMNNDVLLFFLVAVFFLSILSIYSRRVWRGKAILKPLSIVLPALFLVLLVKVIWPSANVNGAQPSWQGEPVQEYADPGQATRVILYGVIADGLAGSAFKVNSLSAIQKEVGFPVKPAEMTPGMAYALKTYGRDGWGREFQINSRRKVSSAGADGKHGTSDDITLTIRQPIESEWENLVSGIYLKVSEKESAVFVHRVADSNFKYAYKYAARKATGTDLYDRIPEREFDGQDPFGNGSSFQARIAKMLNKEISVKEEPLFLIRRTGESGY
jgi:hypothetical protein